MTPLKAKFNASITAYQREYPVIIFAEIRPEKDILNFSQGLWTFKARVTDICTSTSNLSVTQILQIGELWMPLAQKWIKDNIDLTHYYWTHLQDAEILD